MLILFDIDLTLLASFGAGAKAMEDAGRDAFGPSFSTERTEFAGRLDPLIIDDLLRDNAHDITTANRLAIRDGYRRNLARRIAEPGACVMLPGVREIVDVLAAEPRVTIGLLTGNFADTGCMKLRAAGLEPSKFPIAVWGDESPKTPPSRSDLPPIGMSRYRDRHSRDIAAGDVLIIGDTPHDAQCALAHGCRALGVATGHFDHAKLAAANFHRVVPNLSDTADIVEWILGR